MQSPVRSKNWQALGQALVIHRLIPPSPSLFFHFGLHPAKPLSLANEPINHLTLSICEITRPVKLYLLSEISAMPLVSGSYPHRLSFSEPTWKQSLIDTFPHWMRCHSVSSKKRAIITRAKMENKLKTCFVTLSSRIDNWITYILVE